MQCRRLHRRLPFVYSLRLHLPADRRAPAALHEEIDTADELRRFRVRDAWNRRAKAGVSLERLSSRGPGNAVSRLPYRPHGFGQHRAARNPLAHHAGPATQAGRAGVRARRRVPKSRVRTRSSARFIREKWSRCSRRRPRTMSNTMSVQRLPATRRRGPKRCRSRSPKPQASQHALTIQASTIAPPDNAQNAQASAAPPKKNEPDEAAASNNRCDVQACASAYKSFRASDCTYQPFDGPRRVCGKAPEQRADREQRDEPQRRSWSRREDSREVDRRTRWRVYDEDDDDADDVVLFRRSRRW